MCHGPYVTSYKPGHGIPYTDQSDQSPMRFAQGQHHTVWALLPNNDPAIARDILGKLTVTRLDVLSHVPSGVL